MTTETYFRFDQEEESTPRSTGRLFVGGVQIRERRFESDIRVMRGQGIKGYIEGSVAWD